MTDQSVMIWNMAINAACKAYSAGIGAIEALRVPVSVTVEHIGTTTRQEVEVGNDTDQG